MSFGAHGGITLEGARPQPRRTGEAHPCSARRRRGVLVHWRRMRPGSRPCRRCRAPSRSDGHCAAPHGCRAERGGRGRAHAARPAPAARQIRRLAGRCRARAHGPAEGVRPHDAGAHGGNGRPVQADDRGRAARRRPRAQPHGGAWTPEPRPHRLTPDKGDCARSQVRATCCHWVPASPPHGRDRFEVAVLEVAAADGWRQRPRAARLRRKGACHRSNARWRQRNEAVNPRAL